MRVDSNNELKEATTTIVRIAMCGDALKCYSQNRVHSAHRLEPPTIDEISYVMVSDPPFFENEYVRKNIFVYSTIFPYTDTDIDTDRHKHCTEIAKSEKQKNPIDRYIDIRSERGKCK